MTEKQGTMDNNEALNPDLKLLAEARSRHNQKSNRIWIFTATLTLIIFSVKISSDNSVQLLGFNMDAEMLYPVSAALLSLVNIVYISSHLQANKVADLYHEYLEKINADRIEFVNDFTLADAAHTLYSPNINRIFPIADRIPGAFQHVFYLVFKITGDVLLAAIPASGLAYALFKTNFETVYFPLIAFFSFVSLIATVILLFSTLRYTIVRSIAHWRGSNTNAN